jgi:hypothetical protein
MDDIERGGEEGCFHRSEHFPDVFGSSLLSDGSRR